MLVVQLVLGTVTNIYIYMIIVGKSMRIDNYVQYKRVINQITETDRQTDRQTDN